jgi:hypothetical protein
LLPALILLLKWLRLIWRSFMQMIRLQSTNLSKGGSHSFSSIPGKLCLLDPCIINICTHSISNHILFSQWLQQRLGGWVDCSPLELFWCYGW